MRFYMGNHISENFERKKRIITIQDVILHRVHGSRKNAAGAET